MAKTLQKQKYSQEVFMKKLIVLSAFILSACGGGGDGSSPSAPVAPSESTLSFELNSAATNIYELPHTFYVNGRTQAGLDVSATLSFDPQPEATFEGQLSKISRLTFTQRKGNADPVVERFTRFFKFFPLLITGATASGEKSGFNYFVPTSTSRLPASANVGSTGPVASGQFFTDASKRVQSGTGVITYSVEADTANTAFLCTHSTFQNTFNTVRATQSECFRIRPDGTVIGLKLTLGVYDNDTLLETIQFQ
ncbi:hypothetical protein [Limnobacter parvus]|uniref:Lipoprotein n=1 Tax=Limnobacter parvus TaxID=2939690 RepID=A0ABT1XEI5_9BURK|nr:hypothetical protein [Limnobacter parvus]MCR2745691.1 hypothetical protein [Limnobacter parvus]